MNDQTTDGDKAPAREATWCDASIYSLDIPAVYRMFLNAGISRSQRTLQRYCEAGHLKAAKYETETGWIWYVDEESVHTRINEIKQHEAMSDGDKGQTPDDTPTGGDDMTPKQQQHETPLPRGASSGESDGHESDDKTRRPNVSSDDTPASDGDNDIVEFLMSQVVEKDKQLAAKDEQISSLMKTHELDRQHLLQAWDLISTRFELASGQIENQSLGEGKGGPETEPVEAAENKPEPNLFSNNPHPQDDDLRV